MTEKSSSKRKVASAHPGATNSTKTSPSSKDWSTEQVGPTAHVRVRSIPPSTMAKMPISTKIFTEVNMIELVALYLKDLRRSITGRPNTRAHSSGDSEGNAPPQSGD